MCSREFEKRAVVGADDVPPPSAQHQVAHSGWLVAGAVPVVRLGKDPLRAWPAPSLEGRYCLRDAAPGGTAIAVKVLVMEAIRKTVSSVIGVFEAMSARPCPEKNSRRPLRTTPTARPTARPAVQELSDSGLQLDLIDSQDPVIWRVDPRLGQ
jgi:hypothetical protein